MLVICLSVFSAVLSVSPRKSVHQVQIIFQISVYYGHIGMNAASVGDWRLKQMLWI